MNRPILPKLNARGVAHHLVLALIVVGVAIGGTYYLVRSFADTTSAYQTRTLDTGTPITIADGSNGQFRIASNGDMYFIKTNNTGSGKTEIHRLTAASNYQTFNLHVATALPTDPSGTNALFRLGPNNDLYMIYTQSSGSGKIEVHVATAASNYQTIRHYATVMPLANGANGTFDVDKTNGDLYYIQGPSSGTNTIELHRLSAASNYQTWTLHSGSNIGAADILNGVALIPYSSTPATPEFALLKTQNTGCGTYEVHIRQWNGSSMTNMIAASCTAFNWSSQPTDATYELGPNNDFYLILTRGTTGTGTVEVHRLSSAVTAVASTPSTQPIPDPTDRSIVPISGAGTKTNPYVVKCSQYASLFSNVNSGNLTGGWYCSQSSCLAYLAANPIPAGAVATPSCAAYTASGTKQQHLTNPKAWYRSNTAAWFYGLN